MIPQWRLPISKPRILRDDLRFLIFTEVFQRFSEPKKNRRAFVLIETAIQCFDRRGFDQVTFVMVAREAGISRQALSRYFRNVEDLREVTLKYIRILGQQMALELIGKTRDPVKLFSGYVRVHFTWAKVYKSHARVWLGFLSACARRRSDRDLNRLAIEAGNDRIVQIIEQGQKAGLFECSDAGMAARLVQTMITGWTLSLLTEDVEREEVRTNQVVEQCLNIVGYRS